MNTNIKNISKYRAEYALQRIRKQFCSGCGQAEGFIEYTQQKASARKYPAIVTAAPAIIERTSRPCCKTPVLRRFDVSSPITRPSRPFTTNVIGTNRKCTCSQISPVLTPLLPRSASSRSQQRRSQHYDSIPKVKNIHPAISWLVSGEVCRKKNKCNHKTVYY